MAETIEKWNFEELILKMLGLENTDNIMELNLKLKYDEVPTVECTMAVYNSEGRIEVINSEIATFKKKYKVVLVDVEKEKEKEKEEQLKKDYPCW